MEDRNILHTVRRRKDNLISHIWRRNSLLKHIIEGKREAEIEVTGRQGRRRELVLNDLEEMREY